MLSVLYWSMAGDTSESMEKAVRMVENASDSPERDGLMALIYYGGWGVAVDNEKAFFHAERGMRMNDGASCYVLGLMCANGDTPDQREGGRRQVYDHYDAERFMEMAAETDSPWAVKAHLWLGAYFMDSCRGEDPEEGIEHYKAAASCQQSTTMYPISQQTSLTSRRCTFVRRQLHPAVISSVTSSCCRVNQEVK